MRRALLGNQLYLLEGLGGEDSAATVQGINRDLAAIDEALDRADADPTEANPRVRCRRMRPRIRRLTARTSSECLLVGLSGMVLLVQNSSDVISIVDAEAAAVAGRVLD